VSGVPLDDDADRIGRSDVPGRRKVLAEGLLGVELVGQVGRRGDVDVAPTHATSVPRTYDTRDVGGTSR
jgi:hypothetical protein